MSYYVNPPSEPKEDWLKREGACLSKEQAATHSDFTDNLLVILVDNGAFSAAGVAYKAAERDEFVSDPGDSRPKQFFLVSADKLEQVSDWKKPVE